jgi:peptidoglycan lytic transglycosylase G
MDTSRYPASTRQMRNTIIGSVIVLASIALAVTVTLRRYWFEAPPPFGQQRLVTINKGEPFRIVVRDLARAGVVRSEMAMLMYGEFSGTAREIKPGDYEFHGGERIPQVMRHLVKGDVVVVTVTIPEGLSVHQIAERLQIAGLVCQTDFETAARRGPLVRALGLMPLGAEGYLFPATYRFSPRATVNTILSSMLERFYRVLTPQVEERMFAIGLTPRQVVTMASIVEKEARVPGERPLIAGVFYNRLRLGMALQSDPTAEYSLGGETASASAAVRTPSAFNTYAHAGLPPGPIANPGLDSIEAALYPAHTDFLYFVARENGTHVFSRTFNQHKQAIAEIKRLANRAPSPAKPLAAHRAE